MKKLYIIVAFLIAPFAAIGQHATVTATITGLNGAVYSFGTYNISLVSSTGQNISTSVISVGGVPQNMEPVAGNLSSTGSFSVSLIENSFITASASPNPTGTQYNFSICSQTQIGGTGAPPQMCFSGIFAINSTQSLTTQLSALAPPLGAGGSSGTTTYGLTMNNSGTGNASGAVFNGSAAQTLSWNTIGAQQALTLTTTGTSGAATLSSGTLNIPQYSGGGSSAFSSITSGTNTTASMIVGSGANLSFTPFTITAGSSPALVATNQLQTVTLNQNANPSISGITAGIHVVFHICQPSSGGPWTWTWPASIHGGMVIGTANSSCSDQAFNSWNGTTLDAESQGIINVSP